MAENKHFNHPHKVVHVYVRHTINCKHAKKGRYYRGCECPLWLETVCPQAKSESNPYGQIKLSTATTKWDVAEQQAKLLQTGGGAPAAPATLSTSSTTSTTPSIRQAIALFIEYKTHNATAKIKNPQPYRFILGRMADWLELRGVTSLADIQTWHLVDWRGTWKYKTIKKGGKELLTDVWAKHTINVRAFFSWCKTRNFIAVDPAAHEDFNLSPIGREQKQPFTVDEMKAILAAIDKLPVVTRGENAFDHDHQQVRQQKLRALILLMRWSGLALQDALSLERDKLQANDRLLLYRTKTGEEVFVKLPPHVARLLRELPRTNGHFFWNIESRRMDAFMVHINNELHRVAKIAGVKDGSKSHRFRHTFAVQGLNAGIGYPEMARLMGHDERTLHAYYDSWVESRQQKLEDVVAASWSRQDMLQ